MKTDKVFDWMKNWIESEAIEKYDINDLSLLKERLDNTFGSRERILDYIMSDIRSAISRYRHQIDIVISMERKGTKLFRNYIKDSGLYNHVPFNLIRKEDIENKHVLIFDDGIHYGDTAITLIETISSHKPASITFYSVISDIETLNMLKKKYPDVRFYVSERVPKKDYTVSYNRLFYQIFDILPYPLDNHLEFTLLLTNISEPKDILSAMLYHEKAKIYHIPTLEKEELDVIKGTVLYEFNCINQHIDMGFKIEMYKIRFYIYYKGGEGIQFSFTPVVQLSNLDITQCRNIPFKHRLCEIENENENLCLDCFTINITLSLFKSFVENFVNSLKESKIFIPKINVKWNLMKKYGIPCQFDYLSTP